MADENGAIRITNEFAEVTVRRVRTGKGERLEVRDRESGEAIRLDALELEALARSDGAAFDALFGSPADERGQH